MSAFLTTWIYTFIVYLLLTAGSGEVLGLWASAEIQLGVGVSVVAALLSFSYFGREVQLRSLNPWHWARLAGYACGAFFAEMAKANLDVAKRVITGRIRPGIVEVETGMKTDRGLVMLANSITLTPGTLTVDVDMKTRRLFVHMLQVPEGMEGRGTIEAKELFGLYDCPALIRRIEE